MRLVADPMTVLARRSFTNYSRLVMYSFAFQQAFRRGIRPDDQVIIDKVCRLPFSALHTMLNRASFAVLPIREERHYVYAG